MAISYLTNINLNKNQLISPAIHNLAEQPAVGSSVPGQMYFDTVANGLYVFNGTDWVAASASEASYIHPSDGGGSIPTALTGGNVISSITVNSLGHVTATATRALTPGDIGAATSGHTHSTYDRTTSSLTGATVFQDIVVADGIVTGITTRNLTAADIGASADDHNHTLNGLSNVTITSNSSGEILVWNGSAWVNNTLTEAGIAADEHTHGTYDRATSTLSAASVFSDIVIVDGIVTGTSTRNLTAADVGALSSGYTPSLSEVLTALTGAATAPTNGQLLIGDGTDFARATLTEGDNITITNGAGSISIAATDTNTTYSTSAETVAGGANLRLTGSDASTNDVKIAGSGATTVTRTDASTITISSTDNDTTYDVTAPITLSGTTIGHSTDDGDLHVPATGTGNNGKVLMAGATAGSLSWHTLVKADVGLANVTNDAQIKKAASSTIGNIPTWSVTTGDALGAGYSVETTLTGSTTAIARADAVKDYIDGILSSNDAMIFKGTLGTGGTITVIPTTYEIGWTYKVITAGTYAGHVTEIGDLIIATVDRTGTGNLDSDWTVVQTNVDGAVIGPASATADAIALFDGTSGKIIKNSTVLLSSLANINSPTFTGTPAAPTAAADTNTTQLATTAFVVGQAGTATPLANSGSGAVGTSLKYAREDHVHPASSVKYATTITGGTTAEIITHNLGTRDVNVQLYSVASPYDTVFTDVERTSINTVTLRFNVAPSAGQYRVVVIG